MSDLKFDQILDEYVRFCNDSGKIDLNLYEEYNVKRGLRDSNGRGVLTGLTEVSDVMGFSVVDGHRVPIPGELYFQGYEPFLGRVTDRLYHTTGGDGSGIYQWGRRMIVLQQDSDD